MQQLNANLRRWLGLIGVFLVLTAIGGQRWDLPANARPHLQSETTVASIWEWLFPRRRTGGAPSGNRKGKGTRDLCPDLPDRPALTALVPPSRDTNTTAVAPRTGVDYPTFWFYVPYAMPANRWAEFVLIDETEADVYHQIFQLQGTPGIVGIQLPSNGTPLAIGKAYRWVFAVICDPKPLPSDRQAEPYVADSGDIAVSGALERVKSNLNLNGPIDNATLLRQQVEQLGEKGLWHEALTTVARYRQRHGRDAEAQALWQQLLQSAELEDIASAPLTACCVSSKN